MRIKSLTLIGSHPAVLRSSEIDQTLDHWPEQDCPPILTTTTQHVLEDDSILDGTGVAWVILDQADNSKCYELIALLQDRHLPAMLTQPNETKPLGAPFQDGIIIAPLSAGPEPLCAMLRGLWNQGRVVHSLKAEVSFLQAHHGGLCEQIDKIDEELRIAAKLQREFLPEALPTCPGLEFKVLYRPAGYVSGDIYDLMQLDEDHIGFFIADAAGHGVPAALMTMYIKRALHTKDIDPTAPNGYRIIPPDEAMFRLNNDMLRHQTGKTRFATACYGVIHCPSRKITLARAGHPFPFLLRADGSVTTLEPDGMLLGVFPNSQYDVDHAQLEHGDRLLLYSDGFEMAFPDTDDCSDATPCIANMRYEEEFKDIAHGPLDKAMQRLERKLDQQIGSLNQRDDLTAMCIGAVPVTAESAATPAAEQPTASAANK